MDGGAMGATGPGVIDGEGPGGPVRVCCDVMEG